jgi:hypothetical protein
MSTDFCEGIQYSDKSRRRQQQKIQLNYKLHKNLLTATINPWHHEPKVNLKPKPLCHD